MKIKYKELKDVDFGTFIWPFVLIVAIPFLIIGHIVYLYLLIGEFVIRKTIGDESPFV